MGIDPASLERCNPVRVASRVSLTQAFIGAHMSTPLIERVEEELEPQSLGRMDENRLLRPRPCGDGISLKVGATGSPVSGYLVCGMGGLSLAQRTNHSGDRVAPDLEQMTPTGG